MKQCCIGEQRGSLYPLVRNKEVFVPEAGGCAHVISYDTVTNSCKNVAVWQKFDRIDADCMCLLERMPIVKLIW